MTQERQFPIQGSKVLSRIPWSVVAPHARQAEANHSQTIERLAERGGLSPFELWCALEGYRLFDKAAQKQALKVDIVAYLRGKGAA